MKRGEIWWAELGPPAGGHPVLLLSRDEAYAVRELIIVSEVTSTIRHIPSEVPLGVEDGLKKECVVNLDVILTLDKKALIKKLTALSRAKMEEVETAICFALGMKSK